MLRFAKKKISDISTSFQMYYYFNAFMMSQGGSRGSLKITAAQHYLFIKDYRFQNLRKIDFLVEKVLLTTNRCTWGRGMKQHPPAPTPQIVGKLVNKNAIKPKIRDPRQFCPESLDPPAPMFIYVTTSRFRAWTNISTGALLV
jgi:hypothetical protein